MFALLGDILFEPLTSPEEFRATTAYRYAEHQVVEDSPRLQWIANELQTICLGMHFHVAFTNPASQMILLRSAAETHLPLPLVFGNGVFRGFFVIESVEEQWQQCADDGSLVSLVARAELKEWVLGNAFDPTSPAQAIVRPLGIITRVLGA